MSKVKIRYEYLGLKETPDEYFYGVVIEHKCTPQWYEGSEVVDESEVKKRIKDLREIIGDNGKKKYRNIVTEKV